MTAAAGANQLTASATGLTSITFNATGTAAAAASIAVNTGDNQSATVNTNVTAPSVKVTDTYGNAVSGAAVTFAVGSGGGSATGLSPVHVNRSLQELKKGGLALLGGAEARVLDWSGLQDAAGFDPAYLYIGPSAHQPPTHQPATPQ